MLDALKQAMDRTEKLFAAVTPDQYSGPTPCPEYDVRALMNHIVGGNYFLADVAAGKPIDPNAMVGDLIGSEPVTALKTSAQAALTALSDPELLNRTVQFGPETLSGTECIGLGIMETFVHGWDLAKATGQDPTIPAPAAEMLLGAFKAKPLAAEWRGEGRSFGLEVSVPDSASPSDKLVAYLGRTP